MSISITVRHVPTETRNILAKRAASSGRSLQEYLSAELQRLANEPHPEDWVNRAHHYSHLVSPESGRRILNDLEAGRK